MHAFVEMRSNNQADAAAKKLRADAVSILKNDLMLVGSSADPAYLPMLAKVLRSNEPELARRRPTPWAW